MRKTTLSTVFLVVALAAGCARKEPAAEPVRAVRTMVVGAAGTEDTRRFAAEIRARTESRLSFRVPGKMVRRAVDLGDTVKQGQLLAEIDPQDLRLSQQAASAMVQAAQVNLDLAAADFKRYKELRDQGFISGADLERRETTLKAAQAQFEQARAQANVQGNQANYARLVADAAGVVTGIDAEPGAVLAAGTPVLRLAHDGPRDVVFSVPEDQVSVLRSLIGKPQALQVEPWGAQATRVPATVREVAAAADSATRTFQVKADIGAASLRLGQTATVLLPVPTRADLIALPLSALLEQQGKTAVWLVDASMTVRAQPVLVAGAQGNTVMVAQGLQAGQRVVTAGVHVLMPGEKVSLYGEPASPAASANQR